EGEVEHAELPVDLVVEVVERLQARVPAPVLPTEIDGAGDDQLIGAELAERPLELRIPTQLLDQGAVVPLGDVLPQPAQARLDLLGRGTPPRGTPFGGSPFGRALLRRAL